MPAFPQKFTSTVSHWQATNRGPGSLWDHGRDDALPGAGEVVDYVIIGAGVTGASMAYHLTRPGAVGEGKRIVVLEAKDVASGASGRNGGHIAPHGFRHMEALCAPLEEGGAGLTEEEALDVHFFELENLDYIAEMVDQEKMDVDFWRGDRIEVITTQANAELNQVKLRRFRDALQRSKYAARGDVFHVIDDPDEAKKVGRIHNSLVVNKCLGGSWHPHRAVTALLRKALESQTSKCSLYSWTPVSSFTQDANDSDVWTVDCGDRGRVCARNVFVATNGYSHHLFPEEAEAKTGVGAHVVPWRLSAGLVTPPTTFSGARALCNTVSAEDGPYLIQTPHSGLVLGPYHPTVIDLLNTPDEELVFGVEDDSFVFPAVREWISTYCKDNFIAWGPEVGGGAGGGQGEGLARVWTGILGWSVDLVPLVGEVPGRRGLWVSMGYNGMGMASIVNITRHLVNIMKTGKWEGIPACFQVTNERLERARTAKGYP